MPESPDAPPDQPLTSRKHTHASHHVGGSAPVRLGLVALALVLVAVIAGGVWMVLRDAPGTDLQPTVPAATSDLTITPSVTAGATSTPGKTDSAATAVSSPVVQGSPTPRPGSLPDLLRLAPNRLDDDNVPLPFVASYADIATWMELRGIQKPISLMDPALAEWERELGALSLPTSLGTRGTEALWQETYGFNLTQVQQVLTVGQAPNSVTIMTGSFDRDALQAAWVRSGYQAVKVEGMTIWTLFPGDTIDLTSPASRPALGSLNNVVILDDGTFIAAAKLSRLQSVLKVLNGDRDSLADNDDVQDLIASDGEMDAVISAVISKGDLLEASSTATATSEAKGVTSGIGATTRASGETDGAIRASTPTTDASMPEVKLTLIGLRTERKPVRMASPDAALSSRSTPAEPAAATPSQEDDGRDTVGEMVMIIVLEDPDEIRAAQRIVTDRLQDDRSTITDQPYARRLVDSRVDISTDVDRTNVLVIHATLVQGAGDWLTIVETRDLGFAFWEPSP